VLTRVDQHAWRTRERRALAGRMNG
jgi:hypothetical protein